MYHMSQMSVKMRKLPLRSQFVPVATFSGMTLFADGHGTLNRGWDSRVSPGNESENGRFFTWRRTEIAY